MRSLATAWAIISNKSKLSGVVRLDLKKFLPSKVVFMVDKEGLVGDFAIGFGRQK